MKRVSIIITLIAAGILSVILGSCRMNNGDIGHYFGTWSLYRMDVDGTQAEDFDSETTIWSFQNNIIFIYKIFPGHEFDNHIGTWEEADGELLLDYTHFDDNQPAGTGEYSAPSWLGFPKNEIIRLKFVKNTSKEMVLTGTFSDGELYTYYLRKTW